MKERDERASSGLVVSVQQTSAVLRPTRLFPVLPPVLPSHRHSAHVSVRVAACRAATGRDVIRLLESDIWTADSSLWKCGVSKPTGSEAETSPPPAFIPPRRGKNNCRSAWIHVLTRLFTTRRGAAAATRSCFISSKLQTINRHANFSDLSHGCHGNSCNYLLVLPGAMSHDHLCCVSDRWSGPEA